MTLRLELNEYAALTQRELTARETQDFALLREIAGARLGNLLGQSVAAAAAQNDTAEDLALIKLLLARMITVIADEQAEAETRGITAKAVEDFKIEYDKNVKTPLAEFVRVNEDLLKRFMTCTGEMRAGRTDDCAEFVI